MLGIEYGKPLPFFAVYKVDFYTLLSTCNEASFVLQISTIYFYYNFFVMPLYVVFAVVTRYLPAVLQIGHN